MIKPSKTIGLDKTTNVSKVQEDCTYKEAILHTMCHATDGTEAVIHPMEPN